MLLNKGDTDRYAPYLTFRGLKLHNNPQNNRTGFDDAEYKPISKRNKVLFEVMLQLIGI